MEPWNESVWPFLLVRRALKPLPHSRIPPEEAPGHLDVPYAAALVVLQVLSELIRNVRVEPERI